MPTALRARSRAQLVVSGVSVTLGTQRVLFDTDLTVTPTSRVAIVGENGRGKTTLLHVLAGTLVPDEGTVSLVGTLGLAEQEMSTADRRTVGEVVADAVADSLAALAELDTAGLALGENTDGAEERYARALERAEALDAWDAERRIDIALDALGAETDRSADSPNCRSDSATGSAWPACWAPRTTSSCSTNPPTTWTARVWTSSPNACVGAREEWW